MANKSADATPEEQLEVLINKLDAPTQQLLRAVRAALRKRLISANELVYDYGKALVIGYAPGERGIEAPVALKASAGEVLLYFNQAPKLPDPQGTLQGTGKMARFIQLESAKTLKKPDVEALFAVALAQAKIPLPAKGKGSLRIVSDSKKRATRKKSSKS